MRDIDRINRIRDQLVAIDPGRWIRDADENGEAIFAHGPMGEVWELARFHPGASDAEKAFLAGAADTVRYLLGIVDRAVAAMRTAKEKPEPPSDPDKQYAAEAAMKCAEPAFKAFLAAEHGLERPLTDDRCAQKVRTLCGVTSRSELNTPGRAADAWRQLRRDFEAWKRRDGR